jgi:hypothetical protein
MQSGQHTYLFSRGFVCLLAREPFPFSACYAPCCLGMGFLLTFNVLPSPPSCLQSTSSNIVHNVYFAGQPHANLGIRAIAAKAAGACRFWHRAEDKCYNVFGLSELKKSPPRMACAGGLRAYNSAIRL